eukprot:CAMPEP_0179376152 /NCGR_PEP_ID=MMETSP0797-20121207/88172_1 /TAXON_ID=47934 /ORGANISM="Dinophysis acuminata, Strain DAEP01" /LENGTH=235 /DNA_ID=CAMNT_0021092183 /DNA_START=42 /DNA_END=749 /DNA_ORIENTATION=-
MANVSECFMAMSTQWTGNVVEFQQFGYDEFADKMTCMLVDVAWEMELFETSTPMLASFDLVSDTLWDMYELETQGTVKEGDESNIEEVAKEWEQLDMNKALWMWQSEGFADEEFAPFFNLGAKPISVGTATLPGLAIRAVLRPARTVRDEVRAQRHHAFRAPRERSTRLPSDYLHAWPLGMYGLLDHGDRAMGIPNEIPSRLLTHQMQRLHVFVSIDFPLGTRPLRGSGSAMPRL